jgi:hypothetical protein
VVDCDNECEWGGLALDDGRASEMATWWYGGEGERVTRCVRLGTGTNTGGNVSLSFACTYGGRRCDADVSCGCWRLWLGALWRSPAREKGR